MVNDCLMQPTSIVRLSRAQRELTSKRRYPAHEGTKNQACERSGRVYYVNRNDLWSLVIWSGVNKWHVQFLT